MDNNDVPKASPEIGTREPVGDVILGAIDPRTLTQEEFNNSPDLLFHGTTNRSFNFDHTYNYMNGEPTNSHTLGVGFYATDRQDHAQRHATAHEVSGTTARTVGIAPYEARMLDLRLKENTSANGELPSWFVGKWADFVPRYVATIEADTNAGRQIHRYAEKLKQRLNSLHTAADLDTLLQLNTGILKDETTFNAALEKNPDIPSPKPRRDEAIFTREVMAGALPHFMKEQGYDGLIYIESNDDRESNTNSYVFYNLDKIGTYDSWQARKEE